MIVKPQLKRLVRFIPPSGKAITTTKDLSGMEREEEKDWDVGTFLLTGELISEHVPEVFVRLLSRQVVGIKIVCVTLTLAGLVSPRVTPPLWNHLLYLLEVPLTLPPL